MDRTNKLIKYGTIAVGIALLGALLNYIVIQSNGGMPVSGLNFVDNRWIPLTESTRFRYLADILPFNFSIGDIFMLGSGVFFLLMVSRHEKTS